MTRSKLLPLLLQIFLLNLLRRTSSLMQSSTRQLILLSKSPGSPPSPKSPDTSAGTFSALNRRALLATILVGSSGASTPTNAVVSGGGEGSRGTGGRDAGASESVARVSWFMPPAARAEVQYELGPMKMYSADDPKLNPAPVAPSPETALLDLSDPSASSDRRLEVTDRAFIELLVDGQPAGVVTFDLYGNAAPRTVENFLRLIKGVERSTGAEGAAAGGAATSVVGYRGSSVFRVIPGLNIGFGDIPAGSGDRCVKTGTCVSALGDGGGPMPAENYALSHTVPGLVSMARGLGDTVDSRFFVTLPADARWADGRYTAFARIGQSDDSMSVLARIGALETTGTKNAPKKRVTIADCGVL